jgi:hypothetical protein
MQQCLDLLSCNLLWLAGSCRQAKTQLGLQVYAFTLTPSRKTVTASVAMRRQGASESSKGTSTVEAVHAC